MNLLSLLGKLKGSNQEDMNQEEGTFTLLRDSTELKDTEDALKERKNKLEAKKSEIQNRLNTLAINSSDGIIYADNSVPGLNKKIKNSLDKLDDTGSSSVTKWYLNESYYSAAKEHLYKNIINKFRLNTTYFIGSTKSDSNNVSASVPESSNTALMPVNKSAIVDTDLADTSALLNTVIQTVLFNPFNIQNTADIRELKLMMGEVLGTQAELLKSQESLKSATEYNRLAQQLESIDNEISDVSHKVKEANSKRSQIMDKLKSMTSSITDPILSDLKKLGITSLKDALILGGLMLAGEFIFSELPAIRASINKILIRLGFDPIKTYRMNELDKVLANPLNVDTYKNLLNTDLTGYAEDELSYFNTQATKPIMDYVVANGVTLPNQFSNKSKATDLIGYLNNNDIFSEDAKVNSDLSSSIDIKDLMYNPEKLNPNTIAAATRAGINVGNLGGYTSIKDGLIRNEFQPSATTTKSVKKLNKDTSDFMDTLKSINNSDSSDNFNKMVKLFDIALNSYDKSMVTWKDISTKLSKVQELANINLENGKTWRDALLVALNNSQYKDEFSKTPYYPQVNSVSADKITNAKLDNKLTFTYPTDITDLSYKEAANELANEIGKSTPYPEIAATNTQVPAPGTIDYYNSEKDKWDESHPNGKFGPYNIFNFKFNVNQLTSKVLRVNYSDNDKTGQSSI